MNSEVAQTNKNKKLPALIINNGCNEEWLEIKLRQKCAAEFVNDYIVVCERMCIIDIA